MPIRIRLMGALLAALLSGIGLYLLFSPQSVVADGSADSDLFTLTNQDRASNGVGSLAGSGLLGSIGENRPYSGCSGAGTIYGRSEDMINRNYFAHPIPPCGQYVFSMMQAFGVGYRSAGENIGWVSGEPSSGAAASYVNNQFMASPDHRSNILNRNYNQLGIGSWPSSGSWGGCGCGPVWVFSEEFAQVGSSAPPPPPPSRSGGSGGRNSPAPPAPAIPAAATAAPTPVPTERPRPSPTPVIQIFPGLPYLYVSQGVVSDSIESVLEAYLVN